MNSRTDRKLRLTTLLNTLSVNEHWQQVGEMQFMDEMREQNARYVRDHAGRFVFSTLNRTVNYWTGAWLKTIPIYPSQRPTILGISSLSLTGLVGLILLFSKGNSWAWMYLGCLMLYPIAYCVTTTQPRFYHAVTPLLVLLSAYATGEVWSTLRSGHHQSNHLGRIDAGLIEQKPAARA